MMIDLIAPKNGYHYARTLPSGEQTGRILVGERVKKGNGWYIIGHDRKNDRYLELRPVHIIKPVRTA